MAESTDLKAHIQTGLDTLRQRSPIYGTILPTLQIHTVTPGVVTSTLVIDDIHINSKGSLHGAVSATIVDLTTGLAISSHDLREITTTGASVDMHLSYLGTAKKGETVTVVSTAEKVGGSIAFVTVRITVGERMVTLAQHTKYVRQRQTQAQ